MAPCHDVFACTVLGHSKLISCFPSWSNKLWHAGGGKFHYSIMLTTTHVHNYTCFVHLYKEENPCFNYYLSCTCSILEHFNIAQVNHRARLRHAFTSILKNPDFNNHGRVKFTDRTERTKDFTDQGVLGYKHQRPAFQSNFIVSRLMKRHPDWFSAGNSSQ